MSWSINVLGTPDNIIHYLGEEAARQNGQSKIEFMEAMPHLIGLLSNNFAGSSTKDGQKTNYITPTVRLTASGSGTVVNGEQVQRNCSVNLQYDYTKIV